MRDAPPHRPQKPVRAAAVTLALALGLLAMAGPAQAQSLGATDPRAASTLSLAATPEVVDYGGSAVLTGHLSSDGAAVAGTALSVTCSAGGLIWSDVSELSTDANGDFSATVTPVASFGRTTFRATFAGSEALQPAEAQLAVGSRAALGTPSVPVSVGRGSAFSVAGTLAPAHAAGSAAVTVYCYRFEPAGWTLRDTVTALVRDGGAASVYSATLSLPSAGTWRLSAYHADEAHVASWSQPSAPFTVGAGPDEPIWNRDGVTTLPERMARRGGARQLVVVTGTRLGSRSGTLRLFEYKGGDWVAGMSVPARFGSNGLTDGLTRHAGTRTTPTGIWRMPAYVFGTHAAPPSGSRMRYRHITRRSWWSSEDNATYNTWVETSRRVYGEHLIDFPVVYEFAVSSGFNALPNQCVHGRGSGIFLHVRGTGYTAGCVSVARADMIRVLRWLDPAKRPGFAVGTTRTGTATSIFAY